MFVLISLEAAFSIRGRSPPIGVGRLWKTAGEIRDLIVYRSTRRVVAADVIFILDAIGATFKGGSSVGAFDFP